MDAHPQPPRQAVPLVSHLYTPSRHTHPKWWFPLALASWFILPYRVFRQYLALEVEASTAERWWRWQQQQHATSWVPYALYALLLVYPAALAASPAQGSESTILVWVYTVLVIVALSAVAVAKHRELTRPGVGRLPLHQSANPTLCMLMWPTAVLLLELVQLTAVALCVVSGAPSRPLVLDGAGTAAATAFVVVAVVLVCGLSLLVVLWGFTAPPSDGATRLFAEDRAGGMANELIHHLPVLVRYTARAYEVLFVTITAVCGAWLRGDHAGGARFGLFCVLVLLALHLILALLLLPLLAADAWVLRQGGWVRVCTQPALPDTPRLPPLYTALERGCKAVYVLSAVLFEWHPLAVLLPLWLLVVGGITSMRRVNTSYPFPCRGPWTEPWMNPILHGWYGCMLWTAVAASVVAIIDAAFTTAIVVVFPGWLAVAGMVSWGLINYSSAKALHSAVAPGVVDHDTAPQRPVTDVSHPRSDDDASAVNLPSPGRSVPSRPRGASPVPTLEKPTAPVEVVVEGPPPEVGAAAAATQPGSGPVLRVDAHEAAETHTVASSNMPCAAAPRVTALPSAQAPSPLPEDTPVTLRGGVLGVGGLPTDSAATTFNVVGIQQAISPGSHYEPTPLTSANMPSVVSPPPQPQACDRPESPVAPDAVSTRSGDSPAMAASPASGGGVGPENVICSAGSTGQGSGALNSCSVPTATPAEGSATRQANPLSVDGQLGREAIAPAVLPPPHIPAREAPASVSPPPTPAPAHTDVYAPDGDESPSTHVPEAPSVLATTDPNATDQNATADTSGLGARQGDLGCWNAHEDEDEQDYCVGGYHPVAIGDVYDERYEVLSKLGWGQFSTVWLALDRVEDAIVALKVSKSAEDFARASQYEIDILNEVNAALDRAGDAEVPPARFAKLRRSFSVNGPNGTHAVMVLEVCGPSLLKLVSNHDYRGVPVNIVKVIARQTLEALCFLHEVVQVVHTDVKPENILLTCLNPSTLEAAAGKGIDVPLGMAKEHDEVLHGVCTVRESETLLDALDRCFSVKVSDLGAARWRSRRYPVSVVQTREYRCPEVILGAPVVGPAADVWSCACVIFELLTGDYLFDPKNQTVLDRDVFHLCLFMQLLGEVPRHIATGDAEYVDQYFDSNGAFRHPRLQPVSLAEILMHNYSFPPDEAALLVSFLLPMLAFDPRERVSAREALQHPWLSIGIRDG